MTKLIKQVAAGAAALALIFAIAGTASAGAVVYATVTGHAEHSADNNKPETWGEDCVKIGAPGGETYVLEANYSLVVVKAAGNNAGPNANTLFGDSPSAGETVWADTNGNNVYDEDDKQISHIIFCGEEETTTTTTDTFTTDTASTTDETTTTTDTFTTDEQSTTDSTTQPPSDTLGETGSGQQSGSMWLLLAALGILAGSVIVLAPSKAKNPD